MSDERDLPRPPKLPESALRRLFPDHGFHTTIGDLEECFQRIAEHDGIFRARLWYWAQAAKSMSSWSKNSLAWSLTVLKHFLRSSFRLIRRDKLHSFLNILGLSSGIACGLIILLYLQSEMTYDRWNEKADRIFRIGTNVITSGEPIKFALASPALGQKLKNDFPEIEEYVRIRPFQEILVRQGERPYYEQGVAAADPSLFKIFSYRLLQGDPKTCLTEPNTIVLSESLARKYFGEGDPLGQVIELAKRWPVKVTGVMAAPPRNSHMRLQAFVSYSTYDPRGRGLEWPILEIDGFTFLLTGPGFSFEKFDRQWPVFYEKHIAATAQEYGQIFEPIFQKLPDIHYGPLLRLDRPVGNRSYIYAFFAIALFVLILAVVNYVNLSTALAARRSREIGIKKALGSKRSQLVIQLLGESFLFSFLSLLIALGIVRLAALLSPLNSLLDTSLRLDFINNPVLSFGCLGLFIVMGLSSGLYPALYISSFSPSRAIQGLGRSGVFFRRTLVAFQFTISITVVIVTLFMADQIEFMSRKGLGFEKENVVSIQVREQETSEKLTALKEELLNRLDILSITRSFNLPGRAGTGLYRFEGRDGMEEHNYYVFMVGYDYLTTLGIKLVEGRTFSRDHASDPGKAVLINQTLARELGWEKPIGKRVIQNRFEGHVIGVIEDFNFHSLHNPVEPLLIRMIPRGGGALVMRISGRDIASTMSFLRGMWRKINPTRPFVYSFLDENFNRLYDADRRQNHLVRLFAFICILISSLGLLGLASFNAVRRTKETAIRKVHGASVMQIVGLLFREVLLLIAGAVLLATPLALWMIGLWRGNFAFKSGVHPMLFAGSAVGAVILALTTAAYHSVKLACSDPVRSIRYE